MEFPEKVVRKLKDLPDQPGVYMMRDAAGKVIYVGKAASLRKRVQSYFRQATFRHADPKLRGMLHCVADLDYLVLRTEAEAAITEGRFIKDYRPRFNIQFKDDKRFPLLRISVQEPLPRLTKCRIAKQDGALYFGPYASGGAVNAAREFLERRLGLRVCRPVHPDAETYRHCHNDILRFCSAPCAGKITEADYRARVDEACAFLHGERPAYLQEIRDRMAAAAADLQFEQAAALRDLLDQLHRAIRERHLLRKTPELKAADGRQGVAELQAALDLAHPPRVIETYDISNISGTHAVGSMVCAVDGIPQKNRYRLFRIKTVTGSDDPAMMAEVIRRRHARAQQENQPLPDLVLVDGGITQVRAARAELDQLGLAALPVAGLAKRFEELHSDRDEVPRRLPDNSCALKVLQQIRDEAHRFALTYHRKLRARRIRESILDDIPGIGEHRKQQLLAHFGSVARLRQATAGEIAAAPGIGPATGAVIHQALHGVAAAAEPG